MLATAVLAAAAVAADHLPTPELEKIVEAHRLRREDLFEELSELEALAGLVQRLNFPEEDLPGYGEAGKYLDPITDGDARGVRVAPFYATRSPLEVTVSKKPGDREAAVEIIWQDRDRGLHRLALAVDPVRKRAALPGTGRSFTDASFRVVFPHRVQLLVTFGPRGTRLRLFNGVGAYGFEVTPTGVKAGPDAGKPPAPDDLAEWLTVLPLTDNTLRFVLAGDRPDPASAANEPDRHFLRTYPTWAANADGTRRPNHRAVLAAYRAFDRVDRETATTDPAAEQKAVEVRRARLDELTAATRGLHLDLARVQVRTLAAKLAEVDAARRLRSRRQALALEQAGAFDAPPAETAPLPRAARLTPPTRP